MRRPRGTGDVGRAERPLGFTLIELLVVIAVISILASLLMPVALRAARQASSTQCRSNLSQLHRSFGIYGNSFEQSLPPYGYYYRNDPDNTDESWGKRPFWTEIISTFLYPHMPWSDAMDKAVRCPRYTIKTTAKQRGYSCHYGNVFRYVSRNINHHGSTVNSSGSMKLIELGNTSKLLLVFDGQYAHCYSPHIWELRFDRDEDDLIDSHHETGLKYNGGYPLRHDGTFNGVFADGHASVVTLREWSANKELWDPYE